MSVEQYYLAEGAFAYPSSNANDGGEDNSEENLRLITDKFVIKSFVVYRPKLSDTYFIPTYHKEGERIGVMLTGGECSLNGYYFLFGDIFIRTNTPDLKTKLQPSTKYNIVIQIYKDGTAHLRGDGTALVDPNTGELEYRGATAGFYTDAEVEALDPMTSLPLADFTTDENGNPPEDPKAYTLNKFRFVFMSTEVLATPEGQRIEDWVLERLAELDKLQHWENGEIISSVILDGTDVTINLPDRDPISITAIEDRTHVCDAGGRTEVPINDPQPLNYNASTYNGNSILLARADHQHDGRYILKYCDLEDWGTSAIVQRILNSGLAVSGDLIIGRATDSNWESQMTAPSGKYSVNSSDGSINASQGNFKVDGSGNITAKGYVYLSNPSTQLSNMKSGDIATSGNIIADGDITGKRVFNAVWNDYADAVPAKPGEKFEPGDIICKSLCFNYYELSNIKNRKRVVGVYSDTFGHLLGGDEGLSLEELLRNYIPLAVAGNVRVKVSGKVKVGDLIVPSRVPGVGVVGRLFTKGTVIGKALENKEDPFTIERIKIQIMLR